MMTQATATNPAAPLLRIEDLAVSFPVRLDDARTSRGQRARAVNGISLSIYPQQTLAVVGESGCGKSVSALSTLQLIPTPPGRYDSGRILWAGGPHAVDLLALSERQIRDIRGSDIAMIFQEPMTSLNPVYTIGDQIREAILLHQKVSAKEANEIAAKALSDVGIAMAHQRLTEYPHQMSGGMRQRIMIAMALACQPKLLLADEPTTALDVTIQAQILELLRGLQHERHMAVMLITHDLGVVAENADVVAVMYAGRIVEYGSVHDVFNDPLHPYTIGLFESMPVIGKTRDRLSVIDGQVPSLSSDVQAEAVDREGKPTGATVRANPELADVIMRDGKATRIFRSTPDDQPPLREVKPQHWVASWQAAGFEHAKPTRPDLDYRREAAAAQSA